jgi:hypothetical protein
MGRTDNDQTKTRFQPMKPLLLGLAFASLTLVSCKSDSSMAVQSGDAPMAATMEGTCESACEGEVKTDACCDGGGECCTEDKAMDMQDGM